MAAAPQVGLWAFAYESRLDFTMLLGSLFLLAAGAGARSLDAWRAAAVRRSSGDGDDHSNDDPYEFVPGSSRGRSYSTRV